MMRICFKKFLNHQKTNKKIKKVMMLWSWLKKSSLSKTKIEKIFEKALKEVPECIKNDINQGKGREEELYPLYVKEFLCKGFQVTVQGGFYKTLDLQQKKKNPDFKVDLIIVDNGHLVGIEIKGPSIDRSWTKGKEDKKKLKELLESKCIYKGFFVGIFFKEGTKEFKICVEEITKS